MKSVDISALKHKFGTLLSYSVVQCGLSIDILNAKLQQLEYFDFLEKGDIDLFLKDNISDLCFNLFGAREIKTTSTFRNDLKYAGEAYISVSISLSLPLRKLFILYPLDKMLLLYPAYHEMAPFRIIERVNNDIAKESVFSILLKQSDYSINQLSKITSIDRRFLKELSENPKAESKLTMDNLYNLTLALNMNELFLSESRFVPYYIGLWNSDVFVSYMKERIECIAGTNKEIMFFNTNQDEEYKKRINNKDTFVYLDYHEAYLVKKGKKSLKIPSEYFDMAIIFSIKSYKRYCLDNQIAFC